MACSYEEGLEVSDGSLCGICSKKFAIVRRLETCGHIFCERCWFTFVFDLKEKLKGKLDASLDCPICCSTKTHHLQETDKATLELMQTSPLATDMAEADKGSCDVPSEDAGEERSCGPCSESGDDAPGVKYCLECQADLCDSCIETHAKFKSLRCHKLIDTLPEILLTCDNIPVLQKYRKCRKHTDREVELFCKDDDVFICLLCVSTSHKNCRNVVEVTECANEGTKQVHDLKVRMDTSQKHLRTLQQLKMQNISSMKTQTESFVRELKDIKYEIVSSLETTVEKACTQAKQLSKEVEDKENADVEEIDCLKEKFNDKLTFLDAVSKHGNTVELLMSSTQLSAELEKLEDQVNTLDEKLETAEIGHAIIHKYKDLSQQLKPSKVPNISIIRKASHHHPKYSPIPLQPIKFVLGTNECHTVKLVEDGSQTPMYKGITVRDDGHLIMCDYNYYNMLVYKPDGKKRQKIPVNKAYNATQLNMQTVAVAMGSAKKISIVSFGIELRNERLLTTKYQPRGIVSMKNGLVAISWSSPPGFSIADISGATIQESQYLTQDSDGRKFLSFDFMAIDEARKLVIQPCEKDKAVYGFSFTGKPVFKYTNKLKAPRGVAVDSKSGSVFVCDKAGDSIHQLSVKGQHVAVIRHMELKVPLNVCYDKQRKCLWVTHDTIFKKDEISCLTQA